MNKKNKNFLKIPVYQGGSKALNQFINSNLKYPEEALKNKIEGIVFINYEVNDNGEVIFAEVVKGIGHGCDEEALRITKLLKYNKVTNIGQRVKINMKLNIRFRLPQPVLTENTIQYSYVKKDINKTESKTAYSYIINLDQ